MQYIFDRSQRDPVRAGEFSEAIRIFRSNPEIVSFHTRPGTSFLAIESHRYRNRAGGTAAITLRNQRSRR